MTLGGYRILNHETYPICNYKFQKLFRTNQTRYVRHFDVGIVVLRGIGVLESYTGYIGCQTRITRPFNTSSAHLIYPASKSLKCDINLMQIWRP